MTGRQKHREMYMEVAQVISEASVSKKLKVGAIAVNKSGIIGEGYNGTPNGFWTNEPETTLGTDLPLTRPETIHAEMNMLAKITRSGNSSEGAHVFCTHAPCIKCAIQLLQAGVEEVYFANYNPYKAIGDNGARFLSKHGVACSLFNKGVN